MRLPGFSFLVSGASSYSMPPTGYGMGKANLPWDPLVGAMAPEEWASDSGRACLGIMAHRQRLRVGRIILSDAHRAPTNLRDKAKAKSPLGRSIGPARATPPSITTAASQPNTRISRDRPPPCRHPCAGKRLPCRARWPLASSADRRTVRQMPEMLMMRALSFTLLLSTAASAAPQMPSTLPPELAARIDASMADWAKANHVPGLAWGIVHRGEGLVHSGVAGIADVAGGRPVARDTRFRIASMTKAFTALTLFDLVAEGKVRLDDPVSRYVPEVAGWAYPVTVAELVHHMGGFVTDDPWGDRQTPLPEADFTALLTAGVPFTRAPGLAHEYSNLGYALIGRIISNVSGRPFAVEIGARRFQPLGMAATSFALADVPRAQLATGWRWQDGKWQAEPELGPGTFGAMGGVITTAPDYARWVDHLLSAWPAAQPGAAEPAARATVRRLIDGGGAPRRMARPTLAAAAPCTVAVVYGAGFRVGDDCTLGRVAFHSGGYPGYGSHLVMAPDRGWGVFVFTNRTYAGPAPAAWDALIAIAEAGLAPTDVVPLSPQLAGLAALMHAVLTSGDVAKAGLAVNFLMDRDAAHRRADIGEVLARAGRCPRQPGVSADGALEGDYWWKCEKGMVVAHVLLAPTPAPQIQALDWRFEAKP